MTSHVSIIGELTNDPELHYTNSGNARAAFRVADENLFGGAKQVNFVRVTAFSGAKSNFAENIVETLSTGMRVTVTGRLDSYQQTVQKVNDDGTAGQAFQATFVTVLAESVSPDLRWASGQIARNTSDGQQQPPQQPPQQAPSPQPAAQPQPQGQPAPQQTPAPQQGQPQDVPF